AILGELLDVAVPDSWPVFPEAFGYWRYLLAYDPAYIGWANWIVTHRRDKIAIGECSFKGRPDSLGSVSLGYGIVPEYQRRGYGAEAVQALVGWAFAQSPVSAIHAETLDGNRASIRILEKTGMSQMVAQDGRLHWQLRREHFSPGGL
ncbi:MAG: GNAT family N-acetyltransferase, partial [Sulfuricellaceae bacterium]|nr:GNAT family N-acetyltransferase [Sulfuricellaceae bacterium]